MDVDTLRVLLETDMPAVALQVYLSAAQEAVAERMGPPGPVTEVCITTGPILGLSWQALEILSVADGDTVLDPALYALRPSGMIVDLDASVAGAWVGVGVGVGAVLGGYTGRPRRRFTVTYQRISTAGERDRVATQLVKLDLANKPGLDSVKFGSWAETYARTPNAYAEERAALLDSLAGTSEGFLI